MVGIRPLISTLMALVVLGVFIVRGQVTAFLHALTAPAGAVRQRRPLPRGVEELLRQAAKALPPEASVWYASRMRPEQLDPDRSRFVGPGLRPEADELKETARYYLAPRFVYAEGPFEPGMRVDTPAPRYVLLLFGRLQAPAFQPVFENDAGGLYRQANLP